MSAATREALAAAASTVDGVTVTAYHRQQLAPGDGCVRLAANAPADDAFARISTWEIWIVLPQDQADAEAWIDDNLEPLLEALNPEFIAGVGTVTPAELALSTTGGTVKGLVIQGNREQ